MHTNARAWFPRPAAAGLLAALALAPLGCGGGTGTVTGKVTYNGEPLPSGIVLFTNADGKGTQEAEVQPDGSYKVERVPAGLARVAVITTPSVGEAAGRRGPPGSPGGGPPQPMAPPPDK